MSATIEEYIAERLHEVEVGRAIQRQNMEEPSFGLCWLLRTWDDPFPVLGTDEEKRAHAVAWLRTMAESFLSIAREMGATGKVQKYANDNWFGIKLAIGSTVLDASVPAAVACELVPTGEVEVIPAEPERTVPKMEKRCPPSIFRGVQDEALVDAERKAYAS